MLFQRAHRFHQRRFKARRDPHHFAGRFHLCAELAGSIGEFVKRPFWNFDHAIIKCRLKAGKGFLCNRIFNFVQRIAERNFGRNLCNRISGCLGGQRRRTADAWVNFDDNIFEAVGIKRVLHVAAALDPQLCDDIERGGTKHLRLFIRQCLARRNHDGIAGVNAHGVKVFHVADCDAVSVCVAHDLVFNFFPTGDAALDQHLPNTAQVQTLRRNFHQFFLGVGNSAAGSSEGIGRSDNYGVSNLFRLVNAFLQRFGDAAFRTRLMNFFHRFLEQLAVFRTLDGSRRGTDNPNIMLL